jgi:PE-PPE domain
MATAKHIGRVGALAVALGIGNVLRNVTRITASIGVTTLTVTAIVAATPASAVSPNVKLSADTTALILCGTTCPTPDASYIETVKNQYIAPTHPGDIDYVPVTTPEELWPFTGVMRLLGLALGPPSLFGLDAPAWPDEPWWKLSGLFDLTANQSVQVGAAALQGAIANTDSEHVVIYALSQGAGVANVVKKRLAAQYPKGTEGYVPDIDFVLSGDPNLPNGGLMSRFSGLYIPILDFPFNGPAATDTLFDTVEIARQYDGFTDFPLYPLNLIADLNAIMGIVYMHMYSFDVSLPAEDPEESPAFRGTYGDTDYYIFETEDLPLFAPLRTLGVPESVIDVVEPFFRVVVELGYDRSIHPWEPTPARLIPTFDPAEVGADLFDAIGEGINNAAALLGVPPKPSHSAPTAPATEISSQLTANSDTAAQIPQLAAEKVGDTSSLGDIDRYGDRIRL